MSDELQFVALPLLETLPGTRSRTKQLRSRPGVSGVSRYEDDKLKFIEHAGT